jgi:hypothetical protein
MYGNRSQGYRVADNLTKRKVELQKLTLDNVQNPIWRQFIHWKQNRLNKEQLEIGKSKADINTLDFYKEDFLISSMRVMAKPNSEISLISWNLPEDNAKLFYWRHRRYDCAFCWLSGKMPDLPKTWRDIVPVTA